MKLADIAHGTPSTLEVRATGDALTSGLDDAALRLFAADGETLLAGDGRVWAIEGRTPWDASELARVLERGRPRVVWAAVSRRRDGGADLTIQVNELVSETAWTEPVEIGVDERLFDSLKTSRMIAGKATMADALRKLGDWFFFRSLQRPPVVSAVTTLGHGRKRADDGLFSLHGKAHSADVGRDETGRMKVLRVTRLRRSAGGEHDPWRLLHGTLSFADATIAGALRPAVASELDDLVRGADSYLRRWSEYNAIEHRHVLARAQRAGVVRYERCTQTVRGDWRFHLASGFDRAVVGGLAEGGHDDLAAAAEMPRELHPGSSGEAGDGSVPRSEFAGQVMAVDAERGWIDLRTSHGVFEERRPPPAGFLFMSLAGDETRLRRRESARDSIVSTACPMPQLGLLLEGQPVPVTQRRELTKIPAAILRRFPKGATEAQEQALLVAMNTPDIALIQGPPGTGKTDVIAALEAWLADVADARGGLAKSVLLTSYQHDAVDNAASRTIVLDLPAKRIGGRRAADEDGGATSWASALEVTLSADLTERTHGPVVRLARELRDRVRMYALAPLPPDRTATLLEQIASEGTSILSGALRDRLCDRAAELRLRGHGLPDGQAEAVQRAIRALRTTAPAFADDGALMAGKLLMRLRRAGLGTAGDLALLEQMSDVDAAGAEQLNALAELRDRLIDEVGDAHLALPSSPTHDHEARALLADAAREAGEAERGCRDGVADVLARLVDTLAHDPAAVSDTLGNYTAVLAATCQQSVGREMALEKDSGIEFDTVIVDEAARANPLDLMIPLARARRRIVLVGDHRQLPHVLEPAVERELDADVAEATRVALRQSLFERLFEDLKARERAGETRRVVTLDTQFRMHPVLGDFVSKAFYEPHHTTLRSGRSASEFPISLTQTGDARAAWVDIPPSKGGETPGMSKSRQPEAQWIAANLARMMEEEPYHSFGVISFYSAQVQAIERALQATGVTATTDDGRLEIAQGWRGTRDLSGRPIARLRIGTVDAFQGREFDVVVLSLTRSSPRVKSTDPIVLRRRFGHLMLENRLCVAMSRQKRMLMVVGDSAMPTSPEGAVAIPAVSMFYDLCGGEHGARIRP